MVCAYVVPKLNKLSMINLLLLVVFLILPTHLIYADHPSHSLQEIQNWGFKEWQPTLSFSARSIVPLNAPSQIPWPIQFRFTTEQFGASIHQYQNWTSPSYFHAGVDIRGEIHQEVYAPSAGHIEGNYYSYVDDVSGHSTKYFLPLKEAIDSKSELPWGKNYFEIVITNSDGYRFELHHIDPDLLSEEIKTKILNGDPVASGELLGHLVPWPRPLLGVSFHHLHYNILSPDGVYLNPFFISAPVSDHVPPHIVGIYSAQLPDRCGSSYPRLISAQDETNLPQSTYLVLDAYDQIFGGRERLAPPLIRADFRAHTAFQLDFSQFLVLPDGTLPNMAHMYLYYLCDEKGFLQLASKSNHFYFKIPLPPHYSGDVQITVADIAGNSTKRVIIINESK